MDHTKAFQQAGEEVTTVTRAAEAEAAAEAEPAVEAEPAEEAIRAAGTTAAEEMDIVEATVAKATATVEAIITEAMEVTATQATNSTAIQPDLRAEMMGARFTRSPLTPMATENRITCGSFAQLMFTPTTGTAEHAKKS